MKTLLDLSIKSLWHRRETVLLTIVSLTLSVLLVLSVERLRQAAENGFTQTLSQTDLIVGARTGSANLVLATVFNQGVFANNIERTTYERWQKNPAIDWTIPLVLGDGHRGFRVVGTNKSFLLHYRYQGQEQLAFKSGAWFEKSDEVVIGAEVASTLNYQKGARVILEHGVTHDVGMLHHDENPLRVSGILAPTGTIIDQSLFVSEESLEQMHHHGEATEPTSHHSNPHDDRDLTAFFVGLKNRVDVLKLQRDINGDKQEALSAVIPSVVVHDLWQTLGTVERALRLLATCILAVSLLSMLSILMATLNERRREMAILRALGASPQKLAGMLVLESSLITVTALLSGVILEALLTALLAGWLKSKFGLFLESEWHNWGDLCSLALILGVGIVVGLIPAWRVYKTSLKDGLIIK